VYTQSPAPARPYGHIRLSAYDHHRSLNAGFSICDGFAPCRRSLDGLGYGLFCLSALPIAPMCHSPPQKSINQDNQITLRFGAQGHCYWSLCRLAWCGMVCQLGAGKGIVMLNGISFVFVPLSKSRVAF